ncbi:thiol reductant ABC exporter subunit CydC [Acetobacteraceae bacterium]|nr:thiol reductant ABC exporter subunit CydC [Acetobacteraceae bacterium]
MKIMRYIMGPYRWLLWLGLLLSCLAAMANFCLMFLSGWLLAAAAAAGIGGLVARNMFNIALPATGVRFLAISRIVARYGDRLLNHDAALRSTGRLRAWCFRQLIPHSVRLSQMTRGGDFLGRCVTDTEKMGQVYLDVWLVVGTAVISSILASLLVSCFSLPCGVLLCFALFLTGLLLPSLAGLFVADHVLENAKQMESLQGELVEDMQGMSDILFCGEAEERLKKVQTIQSKVNDSALKEVSRVNLLRHLVPVLAVVTLIFTVFLADQAYLQNQLSAPQIAMLALGALAAFEFVAPLVDARLAWHRFKRANERIVALCGEPEKDKNLPETLSSLGEKKDDKSATVETHIATEIVLPSVNRHILVLNEVMLLYPKQDYPVLDRISLVLNQGERVAIIGPSGAGKTSLVRLLAGLVLPSSGSISIKGSLLGGASEDKALQSVGVMAQDFHLFAGSVRDNLLLACPEASTEEMWDVLALAGLADEVKQMENGLDTQVGQQGIRISGGQGRRLAAAQVLLRKPELLILDEPTESLPSDVGTALISSILNALPKAAVVCITHRQEPLVFMDRVLRLQDGKFCPEEFSKLGCASKV